MKKIGDLMQEMGFRKDAPDSVKEAFIKHLIKNTTGIQVQTPSEKRTQNETPKTDSVSAPVAKSAKTSTESAQLVFGFFQDQSRKKEKVS